MPRDRLTACHMVTYFVVGAVVYFAFDYTALFRSEQAAAGGHPGARLLREEGLAAESPSGQRTSVT